MFGRSVPRLAAALALAAVIVTALPVAALGPRGQGGARRGSESWIESLSTWIGHAWGKLTAVWANEGIERDPNGIAAPLQCDQGIEGDPNGCPAQPQGDGGIEIDPTG